MTQRTFNTSISRLLRTFEARLKKCSTDELERLARKKLRDEHNVVFVRTYTVQAHFRPARPQKAKRVVTSPTRPSYTTH